MKPQKSEEVIFKVKFCLFSKPTYIGGNYQSTADKLPLNYGENAKVKGAIELAVWKDGLGYLKLFGRNGKVTIVPLHNVASLECDEFTEEDKKKYSHLL